MRFEHANGACHYASWEKREPRSGSRRSGNCFQFFTYDGSEVEKCSQSELTETGAQDVNGRIKQSEFAAVWFGPSLESVTIEAFLSSDANNRVLVPYSRPHRDCSGTDGTQNQHVDKRTH